MPISDCYSYRGLIHLNPYSYATPIVTPLRPHALRYGGEKYHTVHDPQLYINCINIIFIV